MGLSLTSILSVLFMIFIAHSIWNLIGMFRAPYCGPKEFCYPSYLNSNPKLQLSIYTTESSRSADGRLVLREPDFAYNEPFEKTLSINIPLSTRNNGSLIIHILVSPDQRQLSLKEAIYSRDSVHLKKKLTHHTIPKSSTFQLLNDELTQQSALPVTHLKSKFALTMCTDEISMGHTTIPAEMVHHIRINEFKQFMPIVQQDFLQTRIKDLVEIKNDTLQMDVAFVYAPSSFGKMRFLMQTEAALSQFVNLGFTVKDIDEVKGVFADTNLYLLCATVLIGSIHLLFDFLSFKNDVSFWRGNTTMAGLSTRTVLWRAFSQTVIFLFLLDEGTSLLVLIPSGISTVIEFWKVKKVLKLSITWSGYLPSIGLNKLAVESKAEMQTRQYDEECMRYLSYLLYPLCLCAAVYSLIYQTHKSWYSWTINSLVNAVYAFGFLFMLPQLFVNYRLKSVAALPWRAFMYKAFNTFIDDIFAFIITMPTAHRVACFRDDLIFIVYLYQRWLYPVDKSRTEGIGDGDGADQQIEEKKTN